MVINEKEYDLIPMNAEKYNQYTSAITLIAQELDQPIKRFIEKHCKDLSSEDKSIVLNSFMRNKDWDKPDEQVMDRASRTVQGIQLLYRYTCSPEISWDDLQEFINIDNALEFLDIALKELKPISEEEILEQNKELRKIIDANY